MTNLYGLDLKLPDIEAGELVTDVVTAHHLPRWRADTGADTDGHVWAGVGWVSHRGELTVRVPWSRHAPRDISARVGRILELEAAGRLRTPTIREDRQ